MPSGSDIGVFTALFASNEEALAFGLPHWEPEPGDDVSDEQYAAWEDRNPIWLMKTELACRHIDSDFVEVVWKSGDEPDWDYLATRLHASQVATIRAGTISANTLVLIDRTAIGDHPVELRSTESLAYHGRYPSIR